MAKTKQPLVFNFTDIKRKLSDYIHQNQFLEENVSEEQLEQLVTYVQELNKWNNTYNLSAVRDPYEMLTKHILDSLCTAQSFIGYNHILDVGTGAGLPGIPLAIFFSKFEPNQQFYLLDTLGKRINFLRNVVAILKLKNVTILHTRVEDYNEQTFDCITSRAFAASDKMIELCDHLLSNKGNFVLLKSKLAETEIENLPTKYQTCDIKKIEVPGLTDYERYVVKIKEK